jgi:hypothetical protein
VGKNETYGITKYERQHLTSADDLSERTPAFKPRRSISKSHKKSQDKSPKDLPNKSVKQQTTDRTLVEKYIKEGLVDPKLDYNVRENRENALKRIRAENRKLAQSFKKGLETRVRMAQAEIVAGGKE